MLAGVGFRTGLDSEEAGRGAAKEAMEAMGPGGPDLVFAFCAHALDSASVFAGIRSVTGEAPILGGSAIGTITVDEQSYKGSEVAVAACQLPGIQLTMATAMGVCENAFAAGEEVGRALHASSGPMLIFYDSLRAPASETAPPQIVASPELLRGLSAGMGRNAPLLGAGMVADMKMRVMPRLFAGDRCERNVLTGLCLDGPISCESVIMHGCTPQDGIYHTVTRSEGPVVYELNGRPVVEIINEMFGDTDWQKEQPLSSLTLGINHGDRFGAFEENNFANRLIAGVLPDASGILMFEADLEAGTEVLFMLRNRSSLIPSARYNAEALLTRLEEEGRTAWFGLYIDCAGRTAEISSTEQEEGGVVASAFRERNVPFLGFYSGVEIAPLLGRSRGLDWSGVLAVFAEPRHD